MADNVTPIKRKPRKAPAKPGTAIAPLPDPGLREHELKLAGKSWSEIAQECHHASAHAANRTWVRWLDKARVEVTKARRAQALELEVDRLDTLQANYWDAAISGYADPETGIRRPDLRAAEFVLKVIGQRAKLLGLEEADRAAGSRTVVVSGSRDNYVATLKQLIAGETDVQDAELVDD